MHVILRIHINCNSGFLNLFHITLGKGLINTILFKEKKKLSPKSCWKCHNV